jgi:hypothetical protein
MITGISPPSQLRGLECEAYCASTTCERQCTLTVFVHFQDCCYWASSTETKIEPLVAWTEWPKWPNRGGGQASRIAAHDQVPSGQGLPMFPQAPSPKPAVAPMLSRAADRFPPTTRCNVAGAASACRHRMPLRRNCEVQVQVQCDFTDWILSTILLCRRSSCDGILLYCTVLYCSVPLSPDYSASFSLPVVEVRPHSSRDSHLQINLVTPCTDADRASPTPNPRLHWPRFHDELITNYLPTPRIKCKLSSLQSPNHPPRFHSRINVPQCCPLLLPFDSRPGTQAGP